jgi:hypothetical protein
MAHDLTNETETSAKPDDALAMLTADHDTIRRLSNAGAPSAEPGLAAI